MNRRESDSRLKRAGTNPNLLGGEMDPRPGCLDDVEDRAVVRWEGEIGA
jgi:hypothetical protein